MGCWRFNSRFKDSPVVACASRLEAAMPVVKVDERKRLFDWLTSTVTGVSFTDVCLLHIGL